MSTEKTYTVKTPNPHFTGMRNGVQFTKGKGKATEEQARNLVDVWGYACAAFEDEAEVKSKAEVKDETITDTIGGEEVELVKQDGVLYAHPENTNAALKAFMDHEEIDYESDDNKADLNEKIARWLKAESEVEAEDEVKAEAETEESEDNS